MDFTNKQLDIMHEYVRNMDGYDIIALKGQIAKALAFKGKSQEEIYKVFEQVGNDCKKAREVLTKIKQELHPLSNQVLDFY